MCGAALCKEEQRHVIRETLVYAEKRASLVGLDGQVDCCSAMMLKSWRWLVPDRMIMTSEILSYAGKWEKQWSKN